MRIGWKASQQRASMAEQREVWTTVDEAGFDSLWVFDHLAPMGGDRRGDLFEAWTTLAAIAERTSRVRIGTLVTGNGYRHPVLLAKMAVTVDHLSGGRLVLGLGAGGDPSVDDRIGLPVPSAAERIARLAETCQVLRELWSPGPAHFAGEYVTVDGLEADPPPVQDPLPIWLASNGPRRGLPVVAGLADGWLTAVLSPDEAPEVIRLAEQLDRRCAELGRDPASLTRTVQFPLAEDDDDTLRAAETWARAGFDHLVLMPRGGGGAARAESSARLLPRLRSVG